MINQLLRYLPVLKILRTYRQNDILEVGSGSWGIGKYLDFRFVGVDRSFSDYSAMPAKPKGLMIPIVADACALPFRDDSFHTTVSIDMLEHIESTKRELAVNELLRVSRSFIILGFPCGIDSFECDRKLYRYNLHNGKPLPGWLLEHVSTVFPEESWIIDMLSKKDVHFEVFGNENISVHYLLTILESHSLSAILLGMAHFLLGKTIRVFGPLSFITSLLSVLDKEPCYRKIILIRPKGR